MNPFRYFGRTTWTGEQPTARPLPTQDSTTQNNMDILSLNYVATGTSMNTNCTDQNICCSLEAVQFVVFLNI